MNKYTLSNDTLKVTINSLGAELSSIYNQKNETEYLWSGDSKYWGRQSPVLFPIVGGLKDKQYKYDGNIYPMSQHGFARDSEFTLKEQTENSITFVLDYNETTYKAYPFKFKLEIAYVLEGSSVKVIWRVFNQDEKEMYFSIGGHPGFMCPIEEGKKQTDYAIDFHRTDNIVYSKINESGLVVSRDNVLDIHGGVMPITEHLFDEDAIVIENSQCDKISLVAEDGTHYLTVSFDAPLVGVWSPVKKQAPFICIEPWYGRCDAADFDGELKDREHGNTLQAGEKFESVYTISVE